MASPDEHDVPPASQPAPLEDYLARTLVEQADDLVERWIDRIGEQLELPPNRVLPARDLVDHMPDVLRWTAEYLRLPVSEVRSEIQSRLRLFAQYRREQGYTLEETLSEFAHLEGLLWETVREAIRTYPGRADPVRVTECDHRLFEGLTTLISVTVGMWNEDEADQRVQLARRLEEFARVVVHELKNPLQLIVLACDLLDRPDVLAHEKKRRQCVTSLRNSARSMNDLIDSIRTLAMAEGARSADQWVLVGPLIESVVAELADAAAAHGVECRARKPFPQIKVDAVQVQIALMNLVGNAIKYADRRKRERWVEIRLERVEGVAKGWKIIVADNGLGIPRTLQHKVFRRHFRAHPEVADGTGLGLAITQYVVEQRHGRVGFESTEGEGSTFYIIIAEREHVSQKKASMPAPADADQGRAD